jgi:hypothetical protein
MGIVVVALVGLLAACGGSDGKSGGSGVVTQDADENLPDPPFDVGRTAKIHGVGEDLLFLSSGSKAAAFDFRSGDWRALPSVPFDVDGVTNVDTRVLVIGLDCEGQCESEEPAPVVAASIDLSSDDAGWSDAARLDVPEVRPEDIGLTDAGIADGKRIIGLGNGTFALDPDLTMTRIGAPSGTRWITCGNGRDVDAVASDENFTGDSPNALIAPRIGPLGNAVIAKTSVTEPDWQVVEGSETSRLPAPPGASEEVGNLADPGYLAATATTVTCSTRGVLLATTTETLEWDGAAWITHPVAPASPLGPETSTSTPSGAVAGLTPTNDLSVFDDGRWRAIQIGCAPDHGGDPTDPAHEVFVALTAVGDRAILLNTPGFSYAEAELKVVPV